MPSLKTLLIIAGVSAGVVAGYHYSLYLKGSRKTAPAPTAGN